MFYRPRRRPSGMHATIRALGSDRPAKLEDVSDSGVKLSLKGGLPEGMAVKLVTGRIQIGATVRWTRGDAVGLTLDRKLTPNEQTELSGMSWGY